MEHPQQTTTPDLEKLRQTLKKQVSHPYITGQEIGPVEPASSRTLPESGAKRSGEDEEPPTTEAV